MYRLLLASAAVIALASPATARDGSGYIGLELGVSGDSDAEFDLEVSDGVDVFDFDDAIEVDFRPGRDFDLIGGFDFGAVRAEAELGYKRISFESVDFDDDVFEDLDEVDFDDEGRATVYSLMGNALFDALNDGSSSVYVGGGVGRARVKLIGEKDSAWAWQLIAGARTAFTSNLDVGVKYRFFNTTKLSFSDEDDDGIGLSVDGKYKSHSVLLSLIYNFAAPSPPPAPPPPPPPPPPAAPATQTCPDGSVVLATDMCPVPPPPPPPPPPEPERG